MSAKILPLEAAVMSSSEPWAQNAKLGQRIQEEENYGLKQIVTTIAAGTTGKVAVAALDTDPDLVFDFEILDVTVRTESAVASSTVQVKKGSTAVSDAIVSAANNAITRAGTLDKAQATFLPKSRPDLYAANPCNLVDAGGASAAARTVILTVRKL